MKKIFDTLNGTYITRFVCPSLLLLLSFRPTDNIESPKQLSIRKELKVEGDFKNIRIDGNVSLVMLTNEPAGTIMVEGREKNLNKIKYVLKNDTLFIQVNRVFSFPKLTLYLSARTLKAMQVNGDTNISSSDFIKSDNLHISLNGNIHVNVKTMGKLSVDAPEDFELLWKSPLSAKS